MTYKEKLLLSMLKHAEQNVNTMAVILQSFIQEYGPLSEEAGAQVKALLHGTLKHDEHVDRSKAKE